MKSAQVLSGRNSAYNLREIKGIIANGVEDKVLKLVDRSKQVFPKSGHCVSTMEGHASPHEIKLSRSASRGPVR